MTPRQAGELVELLTRLVLLGEAAEQHLSRLVQATEALAARLGEGPDDDRPTEPLGLVPTPPPGGTATWSASTRLRPHRPPARTATPGLPAAGHAPGPDRRHRKR